MKAVFFFILLSINIFSQQQVTSKINDVVVFKRNAQITRNASFNTISGTQEIILTGISTQIQPSSLQIQFDDPNAILLSAKYEKNHLLPKVTNKKTAALEKKLANLEDNLESFSDQKNSLKGVESILNKNQDLGGANSSFTPQQVILLSDLYQKKFLETKKALRILDKKMTPIEEDIEKIEKQLKEINAKSKRPSGNIILRISSKQTKPIRIKCKYIVNNAGWYPTYDIRSEGTSKNVNLNYKANVYQNTGIDWENISVMISTGNPSRNNNRPILTPLYARIQQTNRLNSRLKNESDEILEEVVSTSNMALEKSSDFRELSTVSENQLSINFNVTNKQTIYSDGKENVMGLKSYELKTEYTYHSVPKLNKSVFLLAKISDWSNYNLIAGKANIFFEGGFVGTSYINPAVTSDSLLISMGVDNAIVIERTPIKNYTSSKFIEKNKKETIGYEFIIKNKKSVPINIEILDQIPVSNNKGIQVVLEEKGTAEYSENIGKLLWNMNILARQTKKEKFIYSVKYPKKRYC